MNTSNKKDNKYQIAVIPGDGIGKEVMEATISVLDELDVDFDYVYGIAGDECNEEHGTPLPQETIDIVRDSDACLFGAAGETAADVIVKIRQEMKMFANLRPVKSYPNTKSVFENVDFMIVRENTEGLYNYVNESSYKLDENRLNFGYFGAIYNARSFEDFINAFDSLNDDLKDKITLHIFTSTKTFFEQLLSPDLYKITNLNPPVNFLEFLNLTTKFDVLLVEDSDKGNFKLNPYLPSKLSDYQGSDAAIWGICEEGSIMDSLNLDYKSKLNDIDSGKKAIEKIIEDKLNLKTKQKDEEIFQDVYNLIDNFMKTTPTPLFNNIEIETVNRCNGTCSFCPVNKNQDPREYKKMPEELFKKIIKELKEINYNGAIALHSNNEPLLDKKICNYAKYTRKELPNSYIYLYTNGTLLTIDKFCELITNLDLLVIDNYNDNIQFIEPVKEIFNYCIQHPELKKKVRIDMRLQNQILTSRGGQSDNRDEILTLKSSCLLPFNKIVVQPDGRIPLCCCDPFGKVILGDLNTEKLVDIWNGKKARALRESLYKEQYSRKNLKLCSKCDVLVEKLDGIPYTDEDISNQWKNLYSIFNIQ